MNDTPHTQNSHQASQIHYSCPMHPEIRQETPGDCPKCGMHLVPESELHQHQGHDHHAHKHSGHASETDGRYDTVPAGYDGPVCTKILNAVQKWR